MGKNSSKIDQDTAKTVKRKILENGLVVGQEKDVSLFLDRTGEPATQQQVSSRLKNKDTYFPQPTTHPLVETNSRSSFLELGAD